VGSSSDSIYYSELSRLARLCRTETTILVSTPEEADLILIIDIYETNWYSNLRRNPIWKQWPEKSYAYQEGNYPVPFLHGLYSSPPNSWTGSGRFRACAYPVTQLSFPNPCPPSVEMSAGPKDLLFSFSGRASHPVRKRLFELVFPTEDTVIEDTSAYDHFHCTAQQRTSASRHYWELVRRSKYALCPRGSAVSSIRLFEMMETGTAPVIISDDWMPPMGPKWEEFALFIPEREIGSLYEKIKAHEAEYIQRGELARKAWEQYFSSENHWEFIMASLRHIKKQQKYPEIVYVRALVLLLVQSWLRPKIEALKWRIRAVIRK